LLIVDYLLGTFSSSLAGFVFLKCQILVKSLKKRIRHQTHRGKTYSCHNSCPTSPHHLTPWPHSSPDWALAPPVSLLLPVSPESLGSEGNSEGKTFATNTPAPPLISIIVYFKKT
uniref:Uncharacterized protein n=1 Tax=Oncorhynchus mykiss TaxID=8022 RepID=A0A8C7VBJ3_ONCMY